MLDARVTIAGVPNRAGSDDRPEPADRGEVLDAREEALDQREAELHAEGTRVERERVAAASDRDQAVTDRRAAASDRRRAATDRREAASDRHAAREYLDAAKLDGLTGAWARETGFAYLEAELDEARARGGTLVVAFVDVVGLKAVNDTAGHASGDRTLQRVVRTLQLCVREDDVVVRYGGDEFVCAVAGVASHDLEARFRAVRAALATETPPIVVTTGYAVVRPDETLAAAVARADEDMYRRRAHGS
jgi:diguanylate cyclase (GGDEF)-like protein